MITPLDCSCGRCAPDPTPCVEEPESLEMTCPCGRVAFGSDEEGCIDSWNCDVAYEGADQWRPCPQCAPRGGAGCLLCEGGELRPA